MLECINAYRGAGSSRRGNQEHDAQTEHIGSTTYFLVHDSESAELDSSANPGLPHGAAAVPQQCCTVL